MITNAKQNYGGDHFVMHINIELFCRNKTSMCMSIISQ